jgi:hypothetical protein
VREAKRLVREPARAENARLAAAGRTSAERQDDLRAFLDKRAPAWRHQ